VYRLTLIYERKILSKEFTEKIVYVTHQTFYQFKSEFEYNLKFLSY